ncbi:unnamed protein product [Lampetra planeri]
MKTKGHGAVLHPHSNSRGFLCVACAPTATAAAAQASVIKDRRHVAPRAPPHTPGSPRSPAIEENRGAPPSPPPATSLNPKPFQGPGSAPRWLRGAAEATATAFVGAL